MCLAIYLGTRLVWRAACFHKGRQISLGATLRKLLAKLNSVEPNVDLLRMKVIETYYVVSIQVFYLISLTYIYTCIYTYSH